MDERKVDGENEILAFVCWCFVATRLSWGHSPLLPLLSLVSDFCRYKIATE
jgi:hypothetical protein